MWSEESDLFSVNAYEVRLATPSGSVSLLTTATTIDLAVELFWRKVTQVATTLLIDPLDASIEPREVRYEEAYYHWEYGSWTSSAAREVLDTIPESAEQEMEVRLRKVLEDAKHSMGAIITPHTATASKDVLPGDQG